MKELWRRFMDDESGQGLVEYVLIVALIALGLILIMLVFRNAIGNVFDNAAERLDNAPGEPYPAEGM